MLLSMGIKKDVVCYEKRHSALHDAVIAYCDAPDDFIPAMSDVIRLLILHGCKYQQRDATHKTPLDLAKGTKRYEELRKLFKDAVNKRQSSRKEERDNCKERSRYQRWTRTSPAQLITSPHSDNEY